MLQQLGKRPLPVTSTARPPAAAVQPYKYVGANADRRLRFDSRADRRWGDWSILELQTPLLWLEADALLEDSLLDQAIIDPWS